MKKSVTLISLLLWAGSLAAQTFEDFFEDKTLRVDYVFSGNAKEQHIYLEELSQTPVWAGRKHHLTEVPLAGNGEITMKDPESGRVLYRHTFSTLFQEWQTTEEATKLDKAFENTYLLPFPKQKVQVEVSLVDVHRKECCHYTHLVDPADILIKMKGADEKYITPHRYLHKGGDPEKCIDVAILAEGYTEAEMDTFYKDAEIACESLFEHEPFKSMQDRFNIVAVATPSRDSGVSIPLQKEWKETAVSSNFSTFYSDRYLTTTHIKQMHDLLSGIPYEHLIILANTDTYGGGGIYNSYTLTTAHHRMFRPVVVHEFGHSFGGLADEYFYDDMYSESYPSDTEPWEPNITTLVDFGSKWKDLIQPGTAIPTQPTKDPKTIYTKVGVFEGAGYVSKGVYRGTEECRMKINEAPAFCPVCQRALKQLIQFYTE
jgi:hypothetical protein